MSMNSRGLHMNRTEQKKLYRCYPVLEQLPQDLFRRVEQEARLVQVPAGQELFHDGTPCTAYPMLIEGTIRAPSPAPTGMRSSCIGCIRGRPASSPWWPCSGRLPTRPG